MLAHWRLCTKKKKKFKFGFSSESNLRVFPCTHIQWVLNFVYQKDRIQVCSINIIHLPCGRFLDLKSMSFTVRSCPFLSFNRDVGVNMCQQQRRTAVWRILLISCSKSKLQLWVVELLDLLIYTFQTSFTHGHYHALWLQNKALRKLLQAYLNLKVCWRQH